MSRTRIGYATTRFACPIVGRTVHFHLCYKTLLSQLGEDSSRVVTKTECSAETTCPIVTNCGPSTFLGWSECAFFKSQDTHSWVAPQDCARHAG